MRILFVGINCPHTTRPLRYLLEAGHEVFMLTYGADPLEGERHPKYACMSLPRGIERTEESVVLMHSVCKRFKPQVVHVHYANYRVWQCTLLPMPPMVVSVWGSDINTLVDLNGQGNPVPTDMYNPLVEEGLRKAATIIVDDPAMVRKVNFMTGGTVPVRLQHLGADELFFVDDAQAKEDLRCRLRLSADVPIITSPRAFLCTNGHELVLRAFAQLCEQRQAVLVLKTYNAEFWSPRDDAVSSLSCQQHDSAGADYLQALQKMATQLGVWQQVRFCGALSLADLRDLYGLSALLVNMPAMDGFPVTFLEAAACGVDVATCWHPAYDTELVLKYFKVLPERSSEALAQTMCEMLDTPATAESRSAARNEVRTHWTHARYCSALMEVYSDALGTKSCRTENALPVM